jgi:hypothetical protein
VEAALKRGATLEGIFGDVMKYRSSREVMGKKAAEIGHICSCFVLSRRYTSK